MISIVLCAAAFIFTYFAGRRSLVAGLVCVIGVGYFYGIMRANLQETYSHFIFDAAVVGLYITQFSKKLPRGDSGRLAPLRLWVGILMGWPFLLFFIPVQDYAVQAVGLRGNVFLLPFILLGARLGEQEVRQLAVAFAVLNLAVFVFAVAEYFLGVSRFYPQNQVTVSIYKSLVDEDISKPLRSDLLRIPATFTGAHAYAGTMVLTFVYLFGAWARRGRWVSWEKGLINAAMVATVLGIFMAAVRSPVIILALVLAVIFLTGHLKLHTLALFFAMVVGVGWFVSSEERLQRFTSLKDTDLVTERVTWSVNENFLELMTEYPMGNGLGGGGTSIPYFLQGRIVPPLFYMESEYARIVLEQGVFGLCLWLAFLVWAFARGTGSRDEPWFLGRRMLWVACAAFFATGMIGTGLLTSIPGTPLLLLSLGWIAVRQRGRAGASVPAAEHRGEGEWRGLPAEQYG
ncbi:MAG TPA: O-antigen ligase family protein [Pyrinomonadaceae bacterium]